jgi:nicotinamide-nucleotide amidase
MESDLMFRDESEFIQRIAVALIKRKERMGVAESCTGGLIGAACTGMPGSSQWFERGVVTYSDQSKTELLGVPSALIGLHGSVSEAVAGHMARGLLAHAPLDWALACTGIAGPAGGSEGKPVGTVWLALAHDGKLLRCWREQFPGDRGAVRLATVHAGLAALADALEERE